jgi:hypothetical protein
MRWFFRLLRTWARGLLRGLVALPYVLWLLLILLFMLPRFLRDVWRAVRRRGQVRREDCCLRLPPVVHKRADPLIYSQSYLLKQGLAVTWDNPDIDLFDNGVLVNPWELATDHDYQVRIRCWNGSYDAPAMGMPVHLVYLSFGIGTTTTYIDTTTVDLGVKASSQCPAFGELTWRTPATPGHYCLQATLDWPDDANPDNNVGQKNTQVGVAHSPAEFTVDVHNETAVERAIHLEVDAYTLPQLAACPEPERPPSASTTRIAALLKWQTTAPSRLAESQRRWATARAEQGYGRFPVPAAWQVAVAPSDVVLRPQETTTVRVTIDTDDATFAGRRAFNLHGFAELRDLPREPVGGVTLFYERG